MSSETKTCQNCKAEFVVEPDDFAFYEKIKVPPPTFCSHCRLQRRLAFLNIFNLYKRPCGLCKKEVISMYRPDLPYTIYCPKCWWSDDWDSFEYGRDYDFSRPFFEQFRELWRSAPILGLSIDISTTTTSPYTNHTGNLKNCYLLFHADRIEDSAYGFYLIDCKSVFDCSLIALSDRCYDSMHAYKVHHGVGLQSQVTESLDCAFLKDCMNCQNCFASANLRNKKYYIFNKPYSREAYVSELKKLDLGSHAAYQDIKRRAEAHWKTLPPKPTMDEFVTNCSGSRIFQSKNAQHCFEVVGVEDSKYLLMVQDSPIKDCYDVSSWGNNMVRCYDSCNIGENVSDLKFCQETGINLYHAEYCKLSTGGSHHFGCVSVKKGEYCILNTQYSREDYEALTAKIREHMNALPYTDARGRIYRYGEFFPAELSPFAYNETIANSFFPLEKSQIEERGYQFAEPEQRTYRITKKTEELPDHIKDVADSILSETIACEACGKGYRIIESELAFLRDMNLPLPRQCPFCRIQEKFLQWVKNLRMISRTCSKCSTLFETKYTEEEAPVVFCKQCYRAEVI